MTLKDRPYIGDFALNRTLVRHTPDARVFINGHEEFATCSSCHKTLNLEKYITTISVEASTEITGGSANFSVSIPQAELEKFRTNGVYLLQPALEVTIFMRGYFPMKDFAGFGDELETNQFDPNEVPVYPYYQVFRGVVTNVSHDFSGGFYSASVQCSNFLHFWQYQHLSVNGAVFGRRPLGSLVEPRLDGHRFTSMGPYSIIYTLVRTTFGAAYGADFMLSQATNIDANDTDDQNTLFAHAAEWWSRRWSQASGRLRMYGINGTMLNNEQQAYLGFWRDSQKEKGFKSAVTALYSAMTKRNSFNFDNLGKVNQTLREKLYDPVSTTATIYKTEDGKKTIVVDDVLKMQAFNFDIGRLANVNEFETEYMTKSEIAAAVTTITGFEFYQDVDGDLVFKPPMFNMDTRDDPVYRIKDRDLISVSESETEPEATMVKGTGSHFANVSGTGIDGWLGVGAVFVDYRLVAKFGYREETFETNYLNNPMAMYVSAINRLDIANSGIKSATVTIPLRPEMRPGYPIYIEHLDCFYYARSISHSFGVGTGCTTTITGVAKRSKWFPPMDVSETEGFPTMEQVRLDEPGNYPQKPLIAYPQYMDPNGTGGGSEGPPRAVGFPNVVMALDPEKLAYDSIPSDLSNIDADAFYDIALNTGFMQRGVEPGTLKIEDGTPDGQVITTEEYKREFVEVQEALAAGTTEIPESNVLGTVLSRVAEQYSVDFSKARQLINYLALKNALKAQLAPGSTVQGVYRYFSSSHPLKEHQAPTNIRFNADTGSLSKENSAASSNSNNVQLKTVPGKGVSLEKGNPTRGLKLAVLSSKGTGVTTETRVVSTGDVRFVSMAPQYIETEQEISRIALRVDISFSAARTCLQFHGGNTKKAFTGIMVKLQVSDPSQTVKDRLSGGFNQILEAIDTLKDALDGAGFLTKKPANISDARQKAIQSLDSMGSPAAGTKSDTSIISGKAETLSGVLWKYLLSVWGVNEKSPSGLLGLSNADLFRESEPGETFVRVYRVLLATRGQFIDLYTGGEVQVSENNGLQIAYVMVPKPREDIGWSPVFPVSDSQGFEVVGNLPYGRGLTIQKYAELASGTKDGEDVMSVGETTPVATTDMGVNEEFFIAWAIAASNLLPDDVSYSNAINNAFDEGERKALSAYYNDVDIADLDAVTKLFAKATSGEVRVRNNPVTSFFRGQSSTEAVAATSLANLDVEDGKVCLCKGAEQDYFLLAFSEEFVDLYGDEPLDGYLASQNYVAGEQRAFTREVLSGEAPDTRNYNLAEQFTKRGDVARTYGGPSSTFNQLGQDLTQLGQEIAQTVAPEDENG